MDGLMVELWQGVLYAS